MHYRLIFILIAVTLSGCKEDAWGTDSKDDEKLDWNVEAEFIENEGFILGSHSTSIVTKDKDARVYMKISVTRSDPFCEDLSSGDLKGEEKVTFSWPVCNGYNSATGTHWIIKDGKHTKLNSSFIEKTINGDDTE